MLNIDNEFAYQLMQLINILFILCIKVPLQGYIRCVLTVPTKCAFPLLVLLCLLCRLWCPFLFLTLQREASHVGQLPHLRFCLITHITPISALSAPMSWPSCVVVAY